jgi:hypothetical protein
MGHEEWVNGTTGAVVPKTFGNHRCGHSRVNNIKKTRGTRSRDGLEIVEIVPSRRRGTLIWRDWWGVPAVRSRTAPHWLLTGHLTCRSRHSMLSSGKQISPGLLLLRLSSCLQIDSSFERSESCPTSRSSLLSISCPYFLV